MVEVEVLVRRAAGMRLVLIRDGVILSVTPLATNEEDRASRRVQLSGFGL